MSFPGNDKNKQMFKKMDHPVILRMAILWNPELAIAIAKASWDHLADGS